MKLRRLPISKLMVLVVMLVALSMLAGWFVATSRFAYLPLLTIILVVVAWRLMSVYSKFTDSLNFILNAVRNNDYSYRFVEDSGKGNYMLNYSLNRVKEILDETKVRISEKEKYFESVIECANIGIIIVLDNGAVVKNNRKALSLLGISMLSHVDRLRPISEELASIMLAIEPAEQRNVRYMTESGEVSILLNCSRMVHEGRSLRVITLENINRELDTQESRAWEKMTRILTHEIMNSLAPVTSISNMLLTGDKSGEQMRQGLETIHSTSDRLMLFVESFRLLTRIPPPEKVPFYLLGVVKEAASLVKFGDVALSVDVEPRDIMVYGDRAQFSQVIVNLLKNAVEACCRNEGDCKVEVRAYLNSDERVHIDVCNNGCAIPREIEEDIFTPFFTTKREGSGVGLAVSKQIIRLHGGMLYLSHNSDGKVVFSILLE